MTNEANNTKTVRDFQDSASARAASFSSLQWLRAFTVEEHAERIRISQDQPKWFDNAE
jgi:hypothetical protein